MLFPEDTDEIRRKMRIQYTLKHHRHHSTHAWIVNWCLWLVKNQLVHEQDHTINTKQIGKIRPSNPSYNTTDMHTSIGHFYSTRTIKSAKKKLVSFTTLKFHESKIVKITSRRQPCSLQMAEGIIQVKPYKSQ